MMRNLANIVLLVLFPLLLATGCRKQIEVEDVPQLNIYLHIPYLSMTRADEGRVPSEIAAENAIHSLQIWAFLSEDFGELPAGTCIGYLSPSPQFLSNGTLNHFAMPLDEELAEAHPDVDLYVLANAISAGYPDLSEQTSRGTLDYLMIRQKAFGINENGSPVYTSVPSTGLPFSGVGKGLKMSGTYPVLSLETVTLKRAVSKLRFVFSQLADDEGPFNDCSVTGIRINGSCICSQEFVFNEGTEPYKIMNGMYETTEMVFPAISSANIACCTEPVRYAFSGQTARAYETLILQGIADGELSSHGLCYLRESDRKLTGQVDYVLNGTQGSASFTMKDPGDFARNHSWIVYVYFTRDAIQFTVSWTPWEEGHDFVLTN